MSCCGGQSKCGSVKNDADLKKMVQKDYGEVARVTAKNADEVAKKFGYSKEELEAIPEGANLGVSCGNPTALASIKEGEVVVDLGSGGGLDCFLASTKVGTSGKVYGIDMTTEMLEIARKNALKRNTTNVEFLQGEIEALPLSDGIADVVISNCVINLVPNKQKAFSEIYRVLKPGGRVAISDIVLKKSLPPQLQNDMKMFSACFSGAMMLSDVSSFLQDAGFQGILVTDAQVDLNAYKSLEGSGSGCCGSVSFENENNNCCGDGSENKNNCCDKNKTNNCCEKKEDKKEHPLVSGIAADFDFNEYASSAKIFAFK